MKLILLTIWAVLAITLRVEAAGQRQLITVGTNRQSGAAREVTRAFLLDRIYGSWVGMLIGGLEGLPHEFKYNNQPRDTLPEFNFLEKGARSDDDNDFEWTHLWFMDKEGVQMIPYPRLVEIWKANMNQGIWVANKRARELMDQGVAPPESGSAPLNRHAYYNLSGQFCIESYGMIAPGMPQAAAEIGLHYARIAVSEEPLQAAQYWTSLISLMAFDEGPLEKAIDMAIAAVDPSSAMAEVVADAQRLHREYPRDWKAARQAIHEKWVKQKKWNMNSTPSNGALVLLALLYGEGDFYKTLQYAMALGYDADCNAATAGAVLGARLGFCHIAVLPQFKMPDRYVNKTRPSLPAECRVSEQAETLMRVSERVILANGGEQIEINGQPGYRVRLQSPRLIEPLRRAAKPRLMVLTDIGGDPDDQQSMIRLMLYANEFELEGLVATASGTPGELKEKVTKPQLIREIIDAYGKVRTNLLRHTEGYPTADFLRALVKPGNPNRGRDAIGAGHDSEASRWIVEAADRPDMRPLNIAVWGGQTDLAQALWLVKQERGMAGLAEFIRQLRIYDIGDQDGIAEWIGQEFPGLFYILGQAPAGRDKREAVYRGLYLGGDETLVSRAWMETNIRQDHGPLGALYPPRTWTAPNPHSAIKEGDTPSWFFFLKNGLGDSGHPDWGGWGGRFTNGQARIFRDAHDTVGKVADARCTVWRWREHFQNDFAVRLDWCAADAFNKANHNPVAVLNADKTKNVIQLTSKPGDAVRLSAEGTSDPDNNALEFRWWIYPEPGNLQDVTARGNLSAMTGLKTSFIAPQVTKPVTIHVILEVRDNGTPTLWSCRRAVVKVQP